MNLFELFAIISLNTSGFKNGLKEASDSMQSFGDRVSNLASAAGKAVTTGLELASAAAIKFGKDSVDVGKQFDAAMANVAAISGATGKAFDDLREKAIEMGGSTRFSATEAADALGYMAMAGWEPQQMMDGLKGVMDLAAASGEELARVSDIVTDALTAFGLQAEDSAHFADVLAVASSASNTNVSMMGETFKYVAPLAGTLKYNIEDMAVSIGLMANAGIKASQAGTSLRAGLTKLVKPTDDAISKLKELGLTVQNMSDEEIATKTAALEQSVTAREKAYNDEEEALQDSLDKQYNALKKSLDARYNAVKETYDSEYDALKKSLDKQYDAQREAFDAEYEAAKKSLDNSYESAKDTYDKQYEERKKTLDAEYDALEAALDAEVEAVQEANEKALDDTKEKQEAEVAAYEQARDDKIAAIDAIYKESLKNTNEDEYKRLQELDAEIAKIQAESDKAAKDAEEAERKQKRAELQAAVSSAKTAEERQKAQQKLENYEANIRLKDAEAKRKADIAALRAQKDTVKDEAKAARDAAKEIRDANISAEKERSAAELKEVKKRNEDNLAELKKTQQAELKEAKAARDEQLQAAKDANAEDLEELKTLNDWRLSTIKEFNEGQLKNLRKSHSDQLDALKEANSDQLNDLKKAQSDQLSAIKDGNEDKLKEAKSGYAKQLKALQDAHKEQLTEYEKSVKEQTDALKKEGEARAAVLTDENGKTRDLINFDKEHLGVLNILREKLRGLSEAQQTEYMSAIVGQEAMSGWLAMINASDEDFSKLVAQIDVASAGTDKFAEAMENNGFSADAMRASMALLGVTQEEFDNALKESNGKVDDFREALQKAADDGTTLEDIDNNLTISGDELDKVFSGMSAAAIMAGTHEDSLAGSATTLDSALETLRIRIADKLTPALRDFTKFAQESVVALTAAFESGGLEGMMDALAPIISDGIGKILEYLPNVVTIGGQILGAVVTGIINNIPLLWDGAVKVASAFVGYLHDALREAFANFGLGEQFDAVSESVSATFEKVRDAVVSAFERIKTAFSDAFGEYFSSGQAAQDITELLTTAIELFGDAVSIAADFVATAVEKIIDFAKWLSEGSTGADLLTAAVGGAVAAFVTFKTALAISALIDTVTKAFEGLNAIMAANPFVLVATLIAGVVTALVVLWNTNEDFRNAVIAICEKLKEVVSGIVDAVVKFFTETIPDALASLREFVSEKTEEIKNFFIGLRDGIMEAFSNIGAWFSEKFTDAYNAVTDAWNGTVQWFTDVRDGIFEAFVNIGIWFSEKFTAAYNAVKTAWNGVGGWFGDRWTDISNVFNGVKEWFSEKFSNAWDGITQAFGGVKDFFTGVWDDITGVFSGAFDWFKGVGENIINGLKEGIGGLWNGFLTLVGLKTDEVKEEFTGKDGFDEHSPSKWAENVFHNVLKGGEIGLDNGLPGILSNAENAIRDIQDALSADPFHVSGGYSTADLSGGYSYARPQLAAATTGAAYGRGQAANSTPMNLTVINEMEVGGVKVERRQRQYRISEDKRVGASLVKL